MCVWVAWWTNWLIDYFDLKPSQNPIPLGFFGRKQGSDFAKTTMETFKRLIDSKAYEIRQQDHEIIFRKAGKVYFGGLDNQETISKFTSAEFAFRAIDQAEETTASDVSDLGGSLRLVINGKRPPYKSLYTANPAESWLKSEFIPPWGPATREEGSKLPYKLFVPALPTDNPHLPDGYIDRLHDSYKYDPGLLKAMIHGDWNVLSGFDKVFNLNDISACFGADQHSYEEKWVIALDSARFGDDKTCIYVGHDRNLKDREIYGKRDHEHTYGRIREWDDVTGNKALIVIDLGGQVGAAVYDSLNKVMSNRLLGINFGGAANKENMKNKRAEMVMDAQQDVLNRRVNIPREWTNLHQELCQIEFGYRNEIYIIEPKEMIKKRLGRSTDEADTFFMWLEGFRHFKFIMNREENPIKVHGWQDEELNQPAWVQRNREAAQMADVPDMGMYS